MEVNGEILPYTPTGSYSLGNASQPWGSAFATNIRIDELNDIDTGHTLYRSADNWLRLNPDGDFTSGIYCGTSILRTDGDLQVGSSGSVLSVDASASNMLLRTGAGGQGIRLRATTSYTSGAFYAPGLLWQEDDGTNIAGIRGAVFDTDVKCLVLGVDWLQQEVFIYDDRVDFIPDINSVPNIYLDSTLYHTGDANTYFQFDAADSARIVTGGVERIQFNSNGIEIPDFIRHAGDTNTYMQFHNADEWRVVTAGTEALEVNATSIQINNRNLDFNGTQATFTNDVRVGRYIYHDGDTNTYLDFTDAGDTWRVVTGGSERFRVDTAGIDIANGSLNLNGNNILNCDRLGFDTADNPGIDTYNNGAVWEGRVTTTDVGTTPADFAHIINLGGNASGHGTQLASLYGTNDNGFFIRRRSDNAGSENGANVWQDWKQIMTKEYADTLYLTGTLSVSGNRWGVIPQVGTGGTIEIGRYIDFHGADGSTDDYDWRIDCGGSSSNDMTFQNDGGTTRQTFYDVGMISATGRSSSYGSTNGVRTGAFNAIMGTSSSATWIWSGTSGGNFECGFQMLDAGNTARLYTSPTGYIVFSQRAISNVSTLTADNIVVNTNILPDADGGADLGSDDVRWSNIYSDKFTCQTGAILTLDNNAWGTQSTHDVLYNGFQTTLGDYLAVRASGNSTSAHGIIVIADNGFYYGRYDTETGAVANSATNPVTTTRFYCNNSGEVTATSFNATSDLRLKNIKSDYFDRAVSTIKAKIYTFKDTDIEGEHIGYIAQEVEEYLPEAVNTDEDGFKQVNYAMVHTAKIAELEETVKKQNAKIRRLSDLVERLLEERG